MHKTTYEAPKLLQPERIRSIEHLDRPETDPSEKTASYADLERISRLPFQFGTLWRAVRRLATLQEGDQRPLRLLELGSGTGAVGLRLARRLSREIGPVDICLTDIQTTSLPPRTQEAGVRVDSRRIDVLHDAFPPSDIVFSNLLIHHFDDADALQVLRKMHGSSRLGGVVYDLDRNRWAFKLLKAFFPLWARSPITVADSLLSVQQAFRREELLDLARRAGMVNSRTRSIFRVRLLLEWRSDVPLG